MQFIYICRTGQNEELRYSIRSVMASFPDADVVVFGSAPRWYKGPLVEVPQVSSKYHNVQRSLKAIATDSGLSSNFVLMNDDFFIVNNIKSITNYYSESLKAKADLHDQLAPYSTYTQKLYQTYDELVRLGIDNPRDFELHTPFYVERHALREAIKYNQLWRSMYGNINNIDGQQVEEDVKVYLHSPLAQKSYDIFNLKYPYLSSDDNSFEYVKKEILLDRFNKPSKYES